jgi:hypothetical protein
MLIHSVFPAQNDLPIIADYKSIIIHILSPNVVLDLFITFLSPPYCEHYKFWTSICYSWPVQLVFEYTRAARKASSKAGYWHLSSPASWSKIWLRASHTVYNLVIVLPPNELWAKASKNVLKHTCMWWSGRGSVSIWWMTDAQTQFYTLILVANIHF